MSKLKEKHRYVHRNGGLNISFTMALLSQYKRKSNKVHAIVVEGYLDTVVYKEAVPKLFGFDQNLSVFYKADGRDNVVELCKHLGDDTNNIIYIVDRDYKPLHYQSNNLYMLRCYSVENIINIKDNIDEILCRHLDTECLLEYHQYESQFLDCVRGYCAFKKSTIENHIYSKRDEHIYAHQWFQSGRFNPFQFDGLDEIRKIRSVIELEPIYMKNLEYLRSHPDMVIGKLVHRFILDYLQHRGVHQIASHFEQELRKLSIDGCF